MTENNLSNGYCPACFKEFRKDFRSIDKNGNCKIHGGQFGQNFAVTKTQQRMAGLGLAGALLLLFAGSKKAGTPDDQGYL